MQYSTDDFKDGKCPNCGSGEIEKDHNLLNMMDNGVGYFIDWPFPPIYKCKKCDSQSKDCFIATTVYCNPDAPQVEALRQFRDNCLSKASWGRALVAVYYSGAGKSTADFIKNHLSSAIPVIRRGLDFLVEKLVNSKAKVQD